MDTSPDQHNPRPPPDEHAETISRYKGIRLRKWGKWVSEVRMPKSRAKIWLGSYDTAEQAARAYDAAVFCLRGPDAQFNFPDCIPQIPCASSLTPEDIQVAAGKYALDQTPNLNDELREEPSSPSMSVPVSELEASGNGYPVSSLEQGESATWENLFGDSDGNPYSNLERLPSLDSATLDFSFAPTAEEQGYIYFDASDLWKM